mmetsp:Transcript_7960/g.11115  ORF Transcript_7960/g.11115 Transcript_7960/m.11115 type:complete len:251 (-) Transcript_7960:487-1239(-)|eukprot:CAMPEP_0197301700 /NCGR_PEP_ID=MMETSP0890-20130614/50566_1 /TAXON_ID=44058 ORGANISM="Aureoumbra lagunensis, Strain CCMP1510" /NCGR_SAMPLE_ID=MMETSP0890 /ASSEMBLY_ACC=CAM_ASM_000533 /LENGTH=250 /DNA_ID=CAMNT_0042781069 /DNA_START=111 /DNA_END=863 /DNA_ORIENTATION=+
MANDIEPTLQEDEIPVAQLLGGGAALWFDEGESSQKIYVDRQFFASYDEQVAALRGSRTVYIGNLSFYTTEAQIYELCSRLGPVKRVIMGLNRHNKTPCGFCFVEYYTPEAALENVGRVTGLVLDDRILRAELDFGFREGRQYGRGQSGGQVRDDRRLVYDTARSAKKANVSSAEPIIPAQHEPDKTQQRKRRFGIPDDEDISMQDKDNDMNQRHGDRSISVSVGSKRRRHGDDDDNDDEEEDNDNDEDM